MATDKLGFGREEGGRKNSGPGDTGLREAVSELEMQHPRKYSDTSPPQNEVGGKPHGYTGYKKISGLR